MVDIDFDTKAVRRRAEVTGVVRRRRWSAEQKGRIVAEAIAPGAVIAEVARRHDLAPQHLSNWIREAKNGRFALSGEVSFVPVVAEAAAAAAPARWCAVEIAIGPVVMRVPSGIDARTLEVVLRVVKRGFA